MSETRKNIALDAMDDGEKEQKKPNGNSTFDAKNYLNVKLKRGENSKELRIRLLPIDKDSTTPFKTIHMHTIQVPPEISQTTWKSYVCLSRTEDIDHDTLGNKCPFCEMNHQAYLNKEAAKAAGDEVEEQRWKEISLKFKPSEVCIMRCIERGAEDDGPKFWKVNVRSDEKDPKNSIKKLMRTRYQESIDEAKADNNGELPEDFVPENILDIYTGKDLKITITRIFTKDGQPTDKTSVSVVDYGKNKPLSADEEQIDAWVNDPKIWSDVFVAKPYDYLSIILDEKIPFYDKANHKWVPKEEVNEEKEKQKEEKKQEAVAADKQIKEAEKKAISGLSSPENETEPEELPF